MKRIPVAVVVLLLGCLALAAATGKKKSTKPGAASPLDTYVREASARSAEGSASTPGAIWLAGSRLADAARDVRASQVDDVLTIVVAEQASAVATGATKTSRASSTAEHHHRAGRHQERDRRSGQPGQPRRRYRTQRAGHHQPHHQPLPPLSRRA